MGNEQTRTRRTRGKKMKKKTTKTLQSLDYSSVCKMLKSKNFLVEYNPKKRELILQIKGVRLPTLNELLSGLQYRKYEVWNYKKTVKEVMSDILQMLKQRTGGEHLFEEFVDLYIYRQGKKLIDNDSLPASFKYYIDSFTLNKIIKDDSPDFIQEVKCFQKIDNDPMFILKLKQSKNKRKKIDDPLDFMRKI